MSWLIEASFDKAIEFCYVHYHCTMLQALDELQQQQTPPYRRGVDF